MKYHSKKTTVCGITFDSKKEAERYLVLKGMEQRGEISLLRLQEHYLLIPSQTGKYRKERKVEYIADFVYIQDGAEVVEDVKGLKTKDYILKRKMMLSKYGISIKEV